MLDHINKDKALAYQFTCLEVSVRNEDIIMTLLESLSPLYVHLITALKTISIKKLTIQFLRAHLMHRMLKKKEMEPQSDDVAMVLY
jgi:hypothetical protein